jgi:ubiquinone/menaquinone biosynthesis C-methylase UbiE
MTKDPINYYRREDVIQQYEKKFTSPGGSLVNQIEVETIASLLNGQTGLCLDIGVGTGRMVTPLSSQGLNIVGLDISEGMLRVAKGKGIPIVYGDARRIPFKDETFDVAIASRVLIHLGDPACYHEASRVLRKNGTFVFDTLNKKSLRWLYAFLSNRIVSHNLESESKTLQKLAEAGFSFEKKIYRFFLPQLFYSKSSGRVLRVINKIDEFILRSRLKAFSGSIFWKAKKTS